jgi:hypothetical protein
VKVIDAAEHLRQPGRQLVDLGRVDRLKIGFVHTGRIDLVDPRHDHLQDAVVDLRRSLHAEVIAVLEAAVDLLVGVPEHAGDRAGFVSQPELEVVIPLAVGAELLVGHQEHLVDLLAFDKLGNVTAGH